jgi:hypothetical protein
MERSNLILITVLSILMLAITSMIIDKYNKNERIDKNMNNFAIALLVFSIILTLIFGTMSIKYKS